MSSVLQKTSNARPPFITHCTVVAHPFAPRLDDLRPDIGEDREENYDNVVNVDVDTPVAAAAADSHVAV